MFVRLVGTHWGRFFVARLRQTIKQEETMAFYLIPWRRLLSMQLVKSINGMKKLWIIWYIGIAFLIGFVYIESNSTKCYWRPSCFWQKSLGQSLCFYAKNCRRSPCWGLSDWHIYLNQTLGISSIRKWSRSWYVGQMGPLAISHCWKSFLFSNPGWNQKHSLSRTSLVEHFILG